MRARALAVLVATFLFVACDDAPDSPASAVPPDGERGAVANEGCRMARVGDGPEGVRWMIVDGRVTRFDADERCG